MVRSWRLGILGVLGLSAWVTLFFVLAIVVLVVEVQHKDDGGVAPTAVLRFLGVIFTACGTAAYVYVGSMAERANQLHWYGVVLLIQQPEFVAFMWAEQQDQRKWKLDGVFAYPAIYAATYLSWGAHKVLFFQLVVQKLTALGPPPNRWLSSETWGHALVASTVVTSSAGAVAYGLGFTWDLRWVDFDIDDAHHAAEIHFEPVAVPFVDRFAMLLLLGVSSVGGSGFCLCACALMLIQWRLTTAAIVKLAQRGVPADLLAKVKRTLSLHSLGMICALMSSQAVIAGSLVDGMSILRNEPLEDLLQALAHTIDVVGDIVGVVLLSGIGTLLVADGNDEEGDITGHIKGLLHSAVLTSRANIVFEGRVGQSIDNSCIVSFPGKFLPEWQVLTWLCEQGEISSACVFLPTSDSLGRFGRHAMCPENEGECWCHSLYGESKPWGCLWFDAWKANVEKAVELQLDLVVVFFPGQAGKGVVDWSDLRAANLWNGVGLGGSQKGEVAYLRRQGLAVIEEDIEATRRRISSRRVRRVVTNRRM